MTNLHILEGTTIKSLWLSDDKTYMKVCTDKGDYCFIAEGDCCSSSWIEHFENVAMLFDNKIDEIQDITSFVDEEDITDECVQVYGIKFIVLGRGTAILEFRNGSNGYYGGWIEMVDEEDCKGEEFKPITEDF